MPHRAILADLHSFRVNVDRLPAARDKALKIIGSLLRTKMKQLLSALKEGFRGSSQRGGCRTVRHCPTRSGLGRGVRTLLLLSDGVEEGVISGVGRRRHNLGAGS
jgi:hypothetical protein